MQSKIRVAIVGYGNLGKGVESALLQNADMQCVGIFTRRNPATIKPNTNIKAFHIDELSALKGQIDVVILCGGSATDLPLMTPSIAKDFNVIDSYDNHFAIPEHFAMVDAIACSHETLAMISVGWDPGLFSINRVLSEAVLPLGQSYTFWGKGVSQGHSDAVRRIDGVLDARQYTIPIDVALDAVRSGNMPKLTTREKHSRLVYVVASADADKQRITQEIVTMPGYFDAYDTTVNFITAEEMARDHSGLPHGGSVFRSGKTGLEQKTAQVIEFSLKLESNPEFTSSVLVCYARAVYRMRQEGKTGCMTVFDVAPKYLSNKSEADLRSEML